MKILKLFREQRNVTSEKSNWCHNSIRSIGQAPRQITDQATPSATQLRHQLPWPNSSKNQLTSLACMQSCRPDVAIIAPAVQYLNAIDQSRSSF